MLTANISVDLGGRPVLEHVELAVEPGERVAIVGPNGSGKSTLLRALAGLLAPKQGSVELSGMLLTDWARPELAKRLAYMPQVAISSFPMSGLEFVLLGRSPHKRGLGLADADDVDMALAGMERLGVAALAARPISAVSGGERQRLGLARVLVQDGSFLLLDEPSSAQDPRGCLLVERVIRDEADRGKGLVVAVHDLNLALRAFDRVAVLAGGGLLGVSSPGALPGSELLERAFSVAFEYVEAKGRVLVVTES